MSATDRLDVEPGDALDCRRNEFRQSTAAAYQFVPKSPDSRCFSRDRKLTKGYQSALESPELG